MPIATSENQLKVIKERETYSQGKLSELRCELKKLDETKKFDGLSIIGAGSFARLEASPYSDIDMFFFSEKNVEDLEEPRTKKLRLFGKMIQIVEDLNFPKFSRDCEFLQILSIDEMLKNLGSPSDDHENYFTARMLLLLESKWLFGETAYDLLIEKVVDNYFKDKKDHEEDFRPTFLLNDICRYWKTILLNYENRRDAKGEITEFKKTKRKVQNYKLKYSRMTTCFATVCAIGSLPPPVTRDQIIELIKMTPRERLQMIPEKLKNTQKLVDELIEMYSDFLRMTGLPESELHEKFENLEKTTSLFEKANKFGDLMFELLKEIDKKSPPNNKLVRHLVI
jgi:hypothetical protein